MMSLTALVLMLNVTGCATARNAMQDEADELVKELNRIKRTASFNNLKLFDNYETSTPPQRSWWWGRYV